MEKDRMIDEKIVKELLSMYDEKNELSLNERYSTKGWQMVFTKPDDNNHWLVFQKKSEDETEVHRTDDTGFITDRDIFSVRDDKLKLISSESYKREREKISIKDNLVKYKEIAKQKREITKQRGIHQYEI